MKRTNFALAVLLVAGCRQDSAPSLAKEQAVAEPAPMMALNADGLLGGSAPAKASERRKALRDFRLDKEEAPPAPAAAELALSKKDDQADAPGGEGGGAQTSAPERAWFPETFLFNPLVVTDAEGRAAVPVRVPDRLTNWRVLALAHSREGGQAGAVASFRGSLPVYVDLVVPAFLMAGDSVRLPIQVVNTTGAEVEQALKLDAAGAEAALEAATVRVAAQGSRVVWATLKAQRPGEIVLKAALGTADAVVRRIPVLPTGRPVELRRGGTLAAPRELKVAAPSNLDAESSRVRLLVYPGALALLRSELSSAGGRGGAAEDAYALLLAGRAAKLLEALGEKADPEALRNLAIVAGQRVVRHGRSPDPATAALLAEAALAHPENPVLARLGERMSAVVAASQRPDGTFGGADGWTLQRLLVSTSEGLRAVKAGEAVSATARQRAASAAIRASGAFERSFAQVEDPYTAAAVLAGGGVSGTQATKLRARVREAIKVLPDGSRELPVPEGAVRADGTTPSVLEATALAVLALEGDPEATWRGDLGARLLGSYEPGRGWGDGRTNLAALQATLALFKDPLPKSVSVTLQLDGRTVAEGVLDAAKLREVVALEGSAADAAGEHVWTVRAEPAVPGLGFAFGLRAWVPWETQESRGLELLVEGRKEGRVGEPLEVGLAVASAAGQPLSLRHALPAGFQPDRAGLERLVSEGTVSSYRAEDGAVVFELPELEAGRSLQIAYRVIPTLSGTLGSGASSLTAGGETLFVPPVAWKIAP